MNLFKTSSATINLDQITWFNEISGCIRLKLSNGQEQTLTLEDSQRFLKLIGAEQQNKETSNVNYKKHAGRK